MKIFFNSKINFDNNNQYKHYFKTGRISPSLTADTATFCGKRDITDVDKTSDSLGNKVERPKFLYHMTRKSAYESMQKEGFIRKSEWHPGGVFMVDFKNFKEVYSKEDVERMLNACSDVSNEQGNIDKSKISSTIVMLEIPVENFQKDLFRVRFHDMHGGISAFYVPWHGLFDMDDDRYEEMQKGTLEYVYTDSIPMSKVRKFAEVNIDELDRNDLAESFFEFIEKNQ